MEKRVVLAIVLMVLVLFVHVWVQETYFAPPKPEPGPQATAPEGKAPGPSTEARKPETPKPAPPAEKPPPTPPTARRADAPRPPETTAEVVSPLYEAEVTSSGGRLRKWTLKYRGDKPLVSVGEQGPLGLLVGPEGAAEPVPMRISGPAVRLGVENPAGGLTLEGEADGLRVRESLGFRADTFTVEARIRIENASREARTVTVSLPWQARIPVKNPPPEKFPGQRPTEVVWSSGGSVHRVEDLTTLGSQVADGPWVAIGSTWYLAALMPKEGDFKLVTARDAAAEPRQGEAVEEHVVRVAARATPTIAPGQVWEGRVVMYIGPKEYDRLAALGLEGTVNFGGFPLPRAYGGLPMEWLGVPILKLMNWLHEFVPNYGVVIIVITVISKVLFYPLTVKGMRSMKAMQALQPQVNNLRNKYRSDPRKLQEETLALYRKHGVNPMGGCLPMIAQVPVFYALYLALSVSVELQNAPFLCFGRIFGVELWVCDLASYDPTYVLPVLMGISMFVQQKMTPTMGDPRQAKMMLVMPFVFTFMFLHLPSGLVLYWFVSNVLQILQQWWMDRPGAGATREAKNAARA